MLDSARDMCDFLTDRIPKQQGLKLEQLGKVLNMHKTHRPNSKTTRIETTGSHSSRGNRRTHRPNSKTTRIETQVEQGNKTYGGKLTDRIPKQQGLKHQVSKYGAKQTDSQTEFQNNKD